MGEIRAAFYDRLLGGDPSWWGYWWTVDATGKKASYWWTVAHPAPIPSGAGLNVYHGVYPVLAKGDEHQRGRKSNIAALGCLFSEWDAKDFCLDCGGAVVKLPDPDGGPDRRVCSECGTHDPAPCKDAALAQAERLEPRPSVLVDSGGGYHAYWLLDRPFVLTTDTDRKRADDLVRGWVAYTGGDPGAKDLARVLRVPGTINCKPERGPDFPMVAFVWAELDRLYRLEDLERLAAPAIKAPTVRPTSAQTMTPAANGHRRPYIEAALRDELATLARTAPGNRNPQLNRSAFALGQLVGGGHLDRTEVEAELERAALAIGLDEREIRATIKSGLDAGEQQPRQIPEPAHPNGHTHKTQAKSAGRKADAGADPNRDFADHDTQEETTPDAAKETQADILIRLASVAEKYRTPTGELYARYPVNDHLETWPIRENGTGFRRWLTKRYFDEQGRPPGTNALTAVLQTLEAVAAEDGILAEVAIRIAEHDGALYLDLGDPQWRAIRITRDGWTVIENPPVLFRRARGMLALPIPERGGTLEDLATFLNVTPGGDDWRLLIGWVIGAFHPNGPYAHLALYGEQGTAKTTATRLLRRLIDPNEADTRAAPREERDLAIAAKNARIIAFDNVSSLPSWLSDNLCRLSTGAASSTRALYTDDEETLFAAKRPVILNGITEVATRGDLLDRLITVTLQPIGKRDRKTEARFWRDFDTAHPRLLGALLDVIVVVLTNRDTVELVDLPRMADFALWVEAAAPALSWTPGDFSRLFDQSQRDAIQTQIEASPFASALLAYCEANAPLTMGAGPLLAAMGKATSEDQRGRDWPSSARDLTGHLRRLAPALRSSGWDARQNGRREWVIRRNDAALFEEGEL